MTTLGGILLLLGCVVFTAWILIDVTGTWQLMIIWTKITSIQFLAGIVLIGALILTAGLLPSSAKTSQYNRVWLIIAITGAYIVTASIIPYLWWGIQMNLLNIPLLLEGGGIGDVFETIRKVIILPSVIVMGFGAILISLGLYQYLKTKYRY